MKAMYSFLSRAGKSVTVNSSQFIATSQAENVLKKNVIRTAGLVALLFLFGGSVEGQPIKLTLTTGTSWQVPPGITSITIECWGGGGAGGGVNGPSSGTLRGYAGGGAGGAYARLNTLSVTPGNYITYQIGAGGAASGTTGQAGNGGDTWFSSSGTVLAKGGVGAPTISVGTTGYPVSGSGGAGTISGSIGDQRWAGGSGRAGDTTYEKSGGGGSSAGSNGNGNSATQNITFPYASPGGTAPTDGGAGASGTSAGTASSPGYSANAISYGGAGGGAAATNTTGLRAGGSGAGGKIVITHATIYYSKSTGALNVLSNWGTSTDGTGTAPSNFIGSDMVFIIRNNATPTISAAWTVSGTRVNVVLGDGTNPCNFTIPSGFAYSGPLDVSANATVTNQNTANPTFGTLNATSTVDYNGTGAQTIAAKNYGNLTLSGTRTNTPAITLASGTIGVSGTFAATLTGSVTYTTTGNTVNFSSASSQTIPAIDYNSLTNTNNGARVLQSTGTITNVARVVNLTLGANSMLIPNGAKLTISGALVNNGGTVKVESGGSLVQEGTTANSGTGTYIAEREMSGSGGSTPSGRHWYMGVPMSGSTSAALNAVGDNRLWYYNEPTAGYVEITDNTTTLVQSKGYVFRGGADGTYSFSSNNIGNGSTTFNLTRTPGVAKSGFNLLSNPYPSHLSWNALYTSTVTSGTSPLLPTVWYRTNNGSVMLFDTYNVSLNTGTNNNMSQAVTGSVAPFQSFWVRLIDGTSSQMTATNAMRSHGTQNFLTLTPATVRLNISNGTYHDETIVVLNEDLSNEHDYRDSDKEIPSATVHQIYSLEGTMRVVINGIANALAKDSLKLGVQIPTAGTYSINCSEFTFSDLVYLEDKLTEAYIQLDNTSTYSFTSEAGTFNNRFVLHFAPYVPALPGQTAATAIAIPTSNWPQCNNVSTEDQWHAFTATSEAVSIAVNTATTDIVIELQDGTGNVVAQENAVNGIGNETLNFFGLTAGQTYKVGVRNNISSQPTGTYGICVKSLKRGGCDYGAGPYSLCQYYKATWAGSTGVSYTFTFTGTSGPAQGQTFTRTQNSDICVLSTVTPLLPYGSTYNVVISNTYTLTDGAGNTEQVTVPSTSGCQVVTIAQPQTTLSASSSCNNGARFRGAVVSSMPWVCGANNWRWRFTEVNPLTMQTVGLPIELNRGAASNYLSLGSVTQLQNGKTYAVQTSPLFAYTGTNYNWGPVQYMCIIGAAQGALQDAEQGVAQGSTKDVAQDAMQGPSEVNALVYVTEGNHVNIQLTNTANNTAKRADIYDVTGKLVKSVRLVEGMNQVELEETTGVYLVRLMIGNNLQTERVFIEK